MKQYYEEISMLRGFAILLVLLGHSIIVFPINLLEIEWCRRLYNLIYYFHMPLFFFIAGFCYTQKDNYKKYIGNKFKRIFIPYITFGIIDLISKHLLPNLVNRTTSLKQDIIRIILRGGNYWFLYVLFIIFIIFPIIIKLMRIVNNKYFNIIIIFILLYLLPLKITNIFDLNNVIYYSFYFVIGYVMKNYYNNRIINIFSKNIIFIISTILFLTLSLFPENFIFKIIKALSGIIFSYSFILKLKSMFNMSKGLELFGKYSLQLYLLNGFMLVTIRVLIVTILKIYNPILIISIIFSFNCILGIFISKYVLDKFRVFRFISGIK